MLRCYLTFMLAVQLTLFSFAPPAHAAGSGLGVYNGSPWEHPDADTEAEFGSAPNVASTYLQASQRIGPYEADRLDRGTNVNLTITARGTQYLAALAAGPTDLGYAAAHEWLATYVADAAALARAHPARKVFVSLEHEAKSKVVQGLLAGASADPVNIGKAQTRLYRMVRRAGVANLKSTYWIVGYDRTFEGTVAANHAVKPDLILFDPYANTATDTLASITRADLTWIRSSAWYAGQPIALGEFGMPVRFGDEALNRFYTDVRGQLSALGIAWAVLFNRAKDNDHQIAGRTDGQVFPQAVTAFTNSL